MNIVPCFWILLGFHPRDSFNHNIYTIHDLILRITSSAYIPLHIEVDVFTPKTM